MDGIGAKLVLLVVLVFWILPDFSASNVAKCSCYSFHGNSGLRQDSREHCQNGTGDLVSMETDEELQFIQNHIQNATTENRGNEWWIGLEGFNENGARKWKWLSNHTALQTPSHPNLQTVLSDEGSSQAFVTISYNALSNVSLIFNIINNKTKRNGWICEYKNKDCDSNQTGIVCKQQGVFEAATSITTTNTYSTVVTATSKITTTIRPTTRKTPPPPPPTTTTTTTTTAPPPPTKPTVTETNTTTTTTPRNTTSTKTSKKTPEPMTPKVAKLTSAAPTKATTTAAKTQRPFFEDFLTTTSAPVRDCLPDPYIVVAITVSVVGGVTVIFFIGLFLFVVCRKNCSKPRKPVEKVEMEEGEYENHL